MTGAIKPGFRSLATLNPYPGNWGVEGWNDRLVRFWRKSHSKQWNETGIFCAIAKDPLCFPMQLSVSLYLRFYVAGSDKTSTWLVLRLPALYACDAKINFTDGTFLNVRDWVRYQRTWTQLLELPVIRLPFWISSTHWRPTISDVLLLDRQTPKIWW